MRKIHFTIIFFILLTVSMFGQTPVLTPNIEETKEAQELAAKFYNRFAETQDITPLITEFFIKDFVIRLKFCRDTGKCGGFARDFWGKEENKFQKEKSDYLGAYTNSINYLFLYYRSVSHLVSNPQIAIENGDSEKAQELVNKQLTELLADASDTNTSEKNNEYEEFKTIVEYRKNQEKFEKLNAALKIIELKNRTEAQKKYPERNFTFSPKNFWIGIDESRKPFFNYPIGTRLVEVLPNDIKFLYFKMDLIKENGKLRIVAIYPPID